MKTLDREHQTLRRMIKTVMNFKSAGKLKEADGPAESHRPGDSIVKLIHAIDAKTSTRTRDVRLIN